MTLEEIFAVRQAEIKSRTQFELCVVSNTQPTFAKAKSCPFSGRVQKVTLYRNATFADYGAKVNGNLSKAGFDADFTPLPSWAEWLRGELDHIVCRHKTYTDRMYLVICGQICDMQITDKWLLDGQLLEDDSEQLAEIKSWLPKKSDNKRQAEKGLRGNEQILFRRISLPNVVAIRTNQDDAKAVMEQVLAQVQVTA